MIDIAENDLKMNIRKIMILCGRNGRAKEYALYKQPLFAIGCTRQGYYKGIKYIQQKTYQALIIIGESA